MPLPSSGAISLNQMHVEAGGTSGTQCSIQDADIRALIGIGPPPASLSFNQWYGASAATTVLSGNSSYQAPSQYTIELSTLTALTPHRYNIIIGPTPHAASTAFTLNGRSTYAAHFAFFPINSTAQLYLLDLTGGSQSTFQNFPANSGWSTLTLSGNGSTLTLSRSAASYSGTVQSLFLNGGTTATSYAGALWQWSITSAQNILPASHNTTSFTLAIG